MAATNALEEEVIAHMFGDSSWQKHTHYIALLTGVTDIEAGTVTEVSDAGYARIMVYAGTTYWTLSGGSASNIAAIQFGDPATAYTVTHVALYVEASGGVPRTILTLTAPVTTTAGGPAVVIPAGELVVSVD